jgi:Cu/Ag efflux pump CusA
MKLLFWRSEDWPQSPGRAALATRLASYGLNLKDLHAALVAANVNQAKGNSTGLASLIRSVGRIRSSGDYTGSSSLSWLSP